MIFGLKGYPLFCRSSEMSVLLYATRYQSGSLFDEGSIFGHRLALRLKNLPWLGPRINTWFENGNGWHFGCIVTLFQAYVSVLVQQNEELGKRELVCVFNCRNDTMPASRSDKLFRTVSYYTLTRALTDSFTNITRGQHALAEFFWKRQSPITLKRDSERH